MLLLAACGGSDGDADPALPPNDDRVSGLQVLPGRADTMAVRLYPTVTAQSDWCVYRTWPDERLFVFRDCGTTSAQPATFSRGAAGELIVLGIHEHGPHLYFVLYDAQRNVPSGRIPGVTLEGVDVLRLDARTPEHEPVVLAQALALGGFDNVIAGAADAAGLTLCAGAACERVTDAAPRRWTSPQLAGYEIVEALPAAGGAQMLLRRLDDGYTGEAADARFHYAWARLDGEGATLEVIPRDCLPRVVPAPASGGSAGWSCVRSRAEMARLLRHDLERMPLQGLMDFGASNLEGRIAWSQAYYLNSLLWLSGGGLQRLGAAANWSDLRRRTEQELALLARLGSAPGAGYGSRRYSMQRSTQTYAIHLGRIARVLDTAKRSGFAVPDAAGGALAERLWTLQGTVEAPVSLTWQGSTAQTLAFRSGADFWCDGCNVPYNYLSAYGHGLGALRGAAAGTDARVAELLAPLLRHEAMDSARTWRYWWGPGHDGWEAGNSPSVNTPRFEGVRGSAHITYRSLDAIALQRLAALSPQAVPPAVLANLRQRVAEGALLPWVNAELALVDTGAVELSYDAAYRHARSAGPWEVEAQVWALESLAGPAPR